MAMPGLLNTTATALVVTLIAVGSGVGAGFLLQTKAGGATAATPAASKDEARGNDRNISVKPVPTILAPLAGGQRAWARADFAILVPSGAIITDAQIADISTDTLAFLSSVDARDFEGPNGFLFLRQDIEERVRTRTGNPALGVSFRSFVVE